MLIFELFTYFDSFSFNSQLKNVFDMLKNFNVIRLKDYIHLFLKFRDKIYKNFKYRFRDKKHI